MAATDGDLGSGAHEQSGEQVGDRTGIRAVPAADVPPILGHNGSGDQAITTGNGHNRESAADSNARNTVDADTVNA